MMICGFECSDDLKGCKNLLLGNDDAGDCLNVVLILRVIKTKVDKGYECGLRVVIN